MKMEIRLTKHAQDMIKDRELSLEIIYEAIDAPDWIEKGYGGIWYSFKRIGQKILRVVVKSEKEPYTIITAYYDKRLKK